MDKRTQSLPAAWQKQKLDMTSPPKQGPSQTMAPTSRSLDVGGGFMDAVMRNRPSSQVEQRSVPQAPIPTEVTDVLSDAPGGYVSQILAGVGSLATEEQGSGGGGNTSSSIGKGLI